MLDACRALGMVPETNLAENAVVSQIQFQLGISVQPHIPLSNARKAALAAAVTESVQETYRRSHARTNKVMTLTGEAEMRIYGDFYLFLSIYVSELNTRSMQFEPCALTVTCRLLIHLIAYLPLEC